MSNEQKTIKNKQINNEDDDFLMSSQIGGWVYVIKSKKDSDLYVGSTNDLRKRFKEHNSGAVRSTKSRIPFKLAYYETYKSEKDAREREQNLKLRSRAFAQLKKRITHSIT